MNDSHDQREDLHAIRKVDFENSTLSNKHLEVTISLTKQVTDENIQEVLAKITEALKDPNIKRIVIDSLGLYSSDNLQGIAQNAEPHSAAVHVFGTSTGHTIGRPVQRLHPNESILIFTPRGSGKSTLHLRMIAEHHERIRKESLLKQMQEVYRQIFQNQEGRKFR